jgi:hypothetical protein
MEAVSWEKASFIKESPNGLEAVSHCTRVTPVYDEGRQNPFGIFLIYWQMVFS